MKNKAVNAPIKFEKIVMVMIKVAYYSFIRVQEVYTINLQI